MKKIKLIIFSGNFLPHIGGLETHVNEFCKYLSKNKKYDITIFTPKISGGKTIEKIHNNVKVIRYPAFNLISNFPFPKFWSFEFYKLLISIYKKDYNLVMTRTRFFSNSLLGLIFAKFRFNKIKLIHVEHGSHFVNLESKFKTKFAYYYDLFIGKMIFLFSNKTIVISNTVKKFVSKNFIKSSKIDLPLIRRGVDFEIYKKIGINEKLKSKFKGKIIMANLCRLYKWKGVANSINAYKSLPKNLQKKSVLIIVGNGEDFNRLEKLSGNFLDNGIYMFGRVDLISAISILKSSDIFLHTSYRGGGLSNSLLQAMNCNCSIIASPNEGANEVINKDNGILLKDNKSENIKFAMIKLLTNKNLRNKYSKNVKEYVKKNFKWEDVIKKYERVFEEVLR